MSFARALGLQEKPHSSITDWVDLLTASNVAAEAYDGIPELVDSINLQASGPAEASRALRKKIKHGAAHQQYRSLVLLKALVENCGTKFQTTFADGQLTDALRALSSDPYADPKVKKKLNLVLASWHQQFKNDPYMSNVTSLYKPHKQPENMKQLVQSGLVVQPDQRTLEREEVKRKLKEEKERSRREEEERKIKARLDEEERRTKAKQAKNKPKREPFNFEKEKPKVLASIVDASQASSNLVNAITLVNPEKESVQVNLKVQECLEKTKLMRKLVVRYIQLVENEEIIGTLIEVNERIIKALELYDARTAQEAEPPKDLADRLAEANLNNGSQSEVNKLQERQRMEVERVKGKGRAADLDSPTSPVHPDLHDLDFGSSSSPGLPAPMRPSSAHNGAWKDSDDEEEMRRGSLSDFSDYESDDDRAAASRRYITVSDNESEQGKGITTKTSKDDDPFADPFAD
ncbi:hypothetical protein DL96DRAFT_1574295 [Flagelloscypha sp. PMI_526]|nr:hypothetical protein DL96DRAFT_1574295 [Flagelloscypha sp. PMI_526]